MISTANELALRLNFFWLHGNRYLHGQSAKPMRPATFEDSNEAAFFIDFEELSQREPAILHGPHTQPLHPASC